MHCSFPIVFYSFLACPFLWFGIIGNNEYNDWHLLKTDCLFLRQTGVSLFVHLRSLKLLDLLYILEVFYIGRKRQVRQYRTSFKFSSKCILNKEGTQLLSLNKIIREANIILYFQYLTLLPGKNSLEFWRGSI